MPYDTTDTVTANDTGEPVVDGEKNRVGTIANVCEDTVAIDLDTALTEEGQTLLGGETANEDGTVPEAALERDPYADLAVFRLDTAILERE